MGGIGGDAHVADLVETGHDAELRIEQEGSVEDTFVVGNAAVVVRLTHGDETLPQFALAGKGFEAVQLLGVVHEGVVFVPGVDDAAPGGPPRDADIGREEIVVANVVRALVAVETADHADALIVLIAVEHLLAIVEERLCGHIVVLQHDALVRQREGPLLRDKFRRVAAVVFLLIETVHFAGPVNLADHLATRHNPWHIALAAGAVLIEEEAGRAGLAHFGKYLFEHIGSVEEEYQYADVERLVRLIHRKDALQEGGSESQTTDLLIGQYLEETIVTFRQMDCLSARQKY